MNYQPMTFRRAIELAAPHTWPASVLPVILGTLLARQAEGRLQPLVFLLTLLVAVLLQSAVNTLNDVRDYVRGTDTLDNCSNESDAAMLFGQLRPRAGLALGLSFLLAAAILGCAIAWLTSWRIWLFGAVAALVIGLYALGASDLPLGELLSGISMGGVLPLAAYFGQCGRCNWTELYLYLPCVITIACIMLTNNTADVSRDRDAGRRTLAVGMGGIWAQRMLCALLLLALLGTALVIVLRFPGGWPVLPVMCIGALLAVAPLYTARLVPKLRDRGMGAALRTHLFIIGGYSAAVAVSLL